MKKDSIIVLSGYLTPEKHLEDESRRRVDRGIELLRRGDANFIVMNGGPGKYNDLTTYVVRGTHPVHCEVMRDYAVSCGVPNELILMQDFSVDSFGEAYFVKEGVLVPKRLSGNIVVSSKYHIPRVAQIYDFVLGAAFDTDFEHIEMEKDVQPSVISSEEELTRIFKKQAAGIPRGNSRAIERALYELHPLYRGLPEDQRRLFYR